jgi:hypothetical protein
MSWKDRLGVAAALILALGAPAVPAADATTEQQSLEEVRNTVINLLQALVDKGLITREQAQALVKQAQDKAAADAAKNAQAAKEEENAVRVPYVPQIVKDEISKQVAEEVKPQVVQSVVAEAKTERWGVPGALPDWISRVHPFGDFTLRGQADMYAADNGLVLDYNGINAAGGIGKDTNPYLDSTENRDRMRLRARLGLEADLTPHLMTVIRLSTGSLTDPSSESPTLGDYGQRLSVGFDQAFIRWNSSVPETLSALTAEGGRFDIPWYAPTEMVYARDLQYEGLASTARLGFGTGGPDRSHVFLTLAAIPMLEVPDLISEDKWLYGAQLGTNLRFFDGGQHLHLAAAYYDFLHVQGVRNTPDSTLTNITAPAFIRYGNTVFDISNNTTDSTVNLFALASQFRLIDVAATYEFGFPRYTFALTGEAVRNIGYNLAQVEALTQSTIPSPQNRGYVAEASFGDPTVAQFGQWRARVGYRYVQADAVIDAWTDADFHGGGTNAAGYYLWIDVGLANNTWLRARYLSANEINANGIVEPGPTGLLRYGLDILQVDLNTRF